MSHHLPHAFSHMHHVHHHMPALAHHAGSAFLSHVGHMIFTALIYHTLFRIMSHIPLSVLIVLAVAAVIAGYFYHARRSSRQNFTS